MTVCAGAFVVRNGQVLLGLRSSRRSLYPNMWDCIGGHVNAAESPREALVRELEEEIQITPIGFHELATLAESEPHVNGDAVYHIFVVTDWDGPGPLMAGHEHSELRWVRVSEAIDMNLAHPGYAQILKAIGEAS